MDILYLYILSLVWIFIGYQIKCYYVRKHNNKKRVLITVGKYQTSWETYDIIIEAIVIDETDDRYKVSVSKESKIKTLTIIQYSDRFSDVKNDIYKSYHKNWVLKSKCKFIEKE